MSLLRQFCPFILTTLASLATGAGLYILYFRLNKELAEFRALIAELKEVKEQMKNNQRSKRSRSKRRFRPNDKPYPGTCSSGDEDDDFVDALAGLSDAEFFGRPSERSVQFASPVFTELGSLTPDPDEELYQQIDGFIADGSTSGIEAAFDLMSTRIRQMSLKAAFQWRLSKVVYHMANAAGEKGDLEKKKTTLYQARDAALAAVKLDPNCAQAHKWYAITLGCVGDYEPVSEKIKNAVVIKQHIQMAIDLDYSDPTPHHMLGRWCYSVYMLSWFERKAAAAFFGSPPTATVEEALVHFMEAERLNPDKWQENLLYVAKCHIEQRQYTDAVEWLHKALAATEEAGEPEVQCELKTLLAKYER